MAFREPPAKPAVRYEINQPKPILCELCDGCYVCFVIGQLLGLLDDMRLLWFISRNCSFLASRNLNYIRLVLFTTHILFPKPKWHNSIKAHRRRWHLIGYCSAVSRSYTFLFLLLSFSLRTGYSLRAACDRPLHFGRLSDGHIGDRIPVALQPSCAALALPNVLRCLFAGRWPAAGDHPNVTERIAAAVLLHNRCVNHIMFAKRTRARPFVLFRVRSVRSCCQTSAHACALACCCDLFG